MKHILLALVVLLGLSGCAGWYGGGDVGRLTENAHHK